ncbi:hypothetical protein NKH47_08115 [Mesorhizobium sp. M1060]|uniref:hypothetical protein n=1 Tax=unclassified Mesorhizobium TaxID=325217 RepID=UPI001FD9FCDF|nr:hypothetical protein [Mesorhizobium sp. L2C089B000]
MRSRLDSLPLGWCRSGRHSIPQSVQHRVQLRRRIALPAVVAAARNGPPALLVQPMQYLGQLHAAQSVEIPPDPHPRSAKILIVIHHPVEKACGGILFSVPAVNIFGHDAEFCDEKSCLRHSVRAWHGYVSRGGADPA